MAAETVLLRYVHKNAQMGCLTIPQVLRLTENQRLQALLRRQLEEYRQLTRESEACLRRLGRRVSPPPTLSAALSKSMLQLKTLTNRSSSHLAQLMIQGSTMGTIQMTRRLHRYPGNAASEAALLGQSLLKTEEANIQQLKQFL